MINWMDRRAGIYMRTNILKLIADFLIPDKGIIYQPLKTKVLYINQDSVLFNRSLLRIDLIHTHLCSIGFKSGL